jgi:2-polyprenyl-3-methyl-5-hydroxy-6-metoxy-1,4-benzoquinol methylase
MKTLAEHWDGIFKKADERKLGWYEENFSQTLKFLNLIPKWENSKIFVAGAGTSGLIEILLKSGAKLVLNDLSSEAITKAKSNYADKEMSHIQWLCHDMSKPIPSETNDIDIWFDRAVLHFLTDDNSIRQYFANVCSALKIGGYAIFAEFSKIGATKCAGLDVRRYDVQDLKENLASFELIADENYTYVNPMGDPRPYIYTLFRKIKHD